MCIDEGLRERQDLDLKMVEIDNCLTISVEVGNLRVVFFQTRSQTCCGPPQALDGFESHQPMGDIGEEVGGSVSLQLPEFHALDELRACSPEL